MLYCFISHAHTHANKLIRWECLELLGSKKLSGVSEGWELWQKEEGSQKNTADIVEQTSSYLSLSFCFYSGFVGHAVEVLIPRGNKDGSYGDVLQDQRISALGSGVVYWSHSWNTCSSLIQAALSFTPLCAGAFRICSEFLGLQVQHIWQ